MLSKPIEGSHSFSIEDRAAHYGHKGGVLWLTGFSASGKTTLSMALARRLSQLGYSCYVLDGDSVRRGLNSDLGFSPVDRAENVRRAGEVAALFADAGLICITAFISPYRSDRENARKACGTGFHEIHIAADIETCMKRDPKGLYHKAANGVLTDFTGVSAPYEPPLSPDLVINTSRESVEESLETLLRYVVRAFPQCTSDTEEAAWH